METEFCRERNEGKIVYEYINNTLEDIKITSPRKRHNEHRTKESVRQRKVIQTLMDRDQELRLPSARKSYRCIACRNLGKQCSQMLYGS